MAVETQNAASHLRLIAHQKSGITHELEAMHEAMREIGAELTKMQDENKLLKLKISKTGNEDKPQSKSSKTVHVDRSGNVKVSTKKHSHDHAHGHSHKHSHGKGHAHDGPWMLGVDPVNSSIRRGSYFGMYTDEEAVVKRRLHRTRSTVDRRFLTPMPGSEVAEHYDSEETFHSDGWHIHGTLKKKN